MGTFPWRTLLSALANHDEALLRKSPGYESAKLYVPDNHYVRAVYRFTPGQAQPFAGFADEPGISLLCRAGKASPNVASRLGVKLIYDACRNRCSIVFIATTPLPLRE